MSSARLGGYAGGFLGDSTCWDLVWRVLAARTLCGVGETSCGLRTLPASRRVRDGRKERLGRWRRGVRRRPYTENDRENLGKLNRYKDEIRSATTGAASGSSTTTSRGGSASSPSSTTIRSSGTFCSTYTLGSSSEASYRRGTTVLVERFLRLQPPAYSGGPNLDTTEHWIHEIERVFAIMRCPQEDRVILAGYQLRGFVQEWWRLKMQTVFTGRTEDSIPWSEFLSVFNDSFFPIQIQQMKREQFRTLQQGNLSVLEYQMRFMALSRYAPYVVTDNTMMMEYFIRGLRAELQDAVIPLMCRTVEEAAQRAAILERTVRARQGQSQTGCLGSGSFRHPQPLGGISKGKAPSGASSSSGIAKWGKQIKKFFQGGRGRGRQQSF
ncbi:hypothetical protein Taro_019335 [Colocasia esculenta]|uniref:Retrotransposon gag domain-containing protein n=1 Tax=Colocasia esculenta TaxID=4460 RepID=A0A843V571_COLES|nr:hypothetical protein [Colocasia esculenta]